MAVNHAFPAGLELEAHKQRALMDGIRVLPPPGTAILSLEQGFSGAAVEPVVAVGTEVGVGTPVAQPYDERATTLHSPVSGRVTAIEPRPAATVTGIATCIVIESDGHDRRDPAWRRSTDVESMAPAELVAQLRAAGIAGLGGAAFPTATKLEAARARGARRLLLNGAECEPWICCDDALMREQALEILHGARLMMRALEAETCLIAIEDDKPDAIAAVQAAIAATESPSVLAVRVVPAIYPQGAERQLVTAVTGAEVPAAGLPADIGITCQNVATAMTVARWAREGEPCIGRVVTVTGSGVASPRNVLARIGTPLATLVDAAGGYCDTPLRLIAGGNMTGRALGSDDAGLSKAMNCILVATAADLLPRLTAVELPCIRCGDCATVCPAALLPQQLHRAALADDEAGLLAHGLWDCIDCGCCDFVCPSRIPLAHRFRIARRTLHEREEARRRAAEARERHERHERRLREAAEDERQAFEQARDRARGLQRDQDLR